MKKIVLCGTPQFAVRFFDAFLNDSRYSVVGVITRAPKLRNGKRLEDSSVAQWARLNELKLFEVMNINKFDPLKLFLEDVDCVLVFAFGQIISEELLSLPKYGFFNIHPSKLPDLRGPSPVQLAIMLGYRASCLTLMKMSAQMDAGDIISQISFDINKFHHASVVLFELCRFSKWICDNLFDYFLNLKAFSQNSEQVTFCKLINKDDYFIKDEEGQEVLNKIRALGYVKFEFKKSVLKCYLAKVPDSDDKLIMHGVAPVFVQLPGKRVLHIRNFLNGMVF